MNEASFKISIGEAVKFLEDVGVFKGRGIKPIGQHSDIFKKVSRSNKHSIVYKTAIDNLDYEILLFDDSIFQFSLNSEVTRYAFIQNPRYLPTKRDFLVLQCGNQELSELSDPDLEWLEQSILEKDYEQFLNEQELNLTSHVIRYDFDPKAYKPLVHSCSHVHIGMNPYFRLPCAKLISPLKFALFSIRHTYYNEWEKFISTDDHVDFLKKAKENCLELPRELWDSKETSELFLS